MNERLTGRAIMAGHLWLLVWLRNDSPAPGGQCLLIRCEGGAAQAIRAGLGTRLAWSMLLLCTAATRSCQAARGHLRP